MIEAYPVSEITAPDGETLSKYDAVNIIDNIIMFDCAYVRYANPLFDNTDISPELFNWETYEFNTNITISDNTGYFQLKQGDKLDNGLTVTKTETAFSIMNVAVENCDVRQEAMVLSSSAEFAGEATIEGIQNYVLGIKSSTDNLEYHGEPLNIDFSIENIGTDLEVGFMIVSGGVPVESEINGERSILHIISVKEKETFDFSAAFDVYGNGDTYFHPLCILEPNTRINNVNKHFGNSFRIVTTAPIKVTSDSTSSTKTKLARSSKFITADESNLKKYRLEDTDTRMIILEQTEPKHITAVISGTQIETESSLFFSVNGVPTTVNGGNNAILVSEKKGGLAVVDAVFDTEPNDGDVITAILAPTNDNYEIPSTYLFGADPISYNNSVAITAETTTAVTTTTTAIEEIPALPVSDTEQNTSAVSPPTTAVQPQAVSANTSGEYYNGDCIGETSSGNLIAAGYTELALLSPNGEILKTENASGLSQFELIMNSGRTFSGVAAGKPYNAVIYPGEPESYNVYLYDEDLRLADTIAVDKCSYAAVGTEHIATVPFYYSNVNLCTMSVVVWSQ